jgi:HSP20 family protein
MNAPVQVPVKHAATTARGFPNAFGSLQREIDRLFDDFSPSFLTGRDDADVRCRMDLADAKDGLELTVEGPGPDEKDVQVIVADGVLSVSGEKKFGSEQKDKNDRFVERGYGAFSRSTPRPEDPKAEDIKADLSKGLLKVAVPTAPKAEPRQIEVKATA